MTRAIDIPRDERGVYRVFSLSMTNAEAEALRANAPDGDDGPTPQQALLGAQYLDADFTEVFAVKDLEGLGLAGYLETGNGVDPAQLAPDAQRLAALDGWVFMVLSQAFGGFAQTLTPAPELTLIGTYTEERRDFVGDGLPVTAESAKPQVVVPQAPAPGGKPKRKRSDAAMSGMVATAVLIVLALFTTVLIWIA